ncbi:MAG: Hsp20/alpha crystallin family protein [Desulforhabdus sp.]|jgi:HSP20 family protein|nr:Hsp20/alpha crystallin family protein [Desulforhabdus sp.]
MAIIRYPRFSEFQSPFGEMERLRREMDRLFSDVMGRGPAAMTSGVFPALNVSEDADKIYIQAELPGFKPEDIDISVEKETLTLRGERKPEQVENVSYHRRERRTGKFQKALTLPYAVNADGVDAQFKNGVLKLVLPKAEHMKPKKIAIKSE